MKWISLWLAILVILGAFSFKAEKGGKEKDGAGSEVAVSVASEETQEVNIVFPAEVETGSEKLYPAVATVNGEQQMGYINVKGEMVLAPNYAGANPFYEGLAVVWEPRIEGNTEGSYYINAKGEKQFGTEFWDATEFNEGRAAVRGKDDKWRVIDIENNKVYLLDERTNWIWGGYNDGMICVRNKDDEYGYCNEYGELVIPFGYRMAEPFNSGLAVVTRLEDDRILYIDKTGKIVIKTEADTDDPLVHFDNYEFSEGLAYVGDGYINKKGDYAIRFDWGLKDGGGRPFYEGVALVYTNEKLYFINKNGEVVIDISQYSSAGDFINGMAWISDGFGFGFINKKGEVVIEPGFYVPGDWPDENFFECQFTVDGFYQGIYMGKDDSWEGYIDTQGNIIYKD